MTRTRSFAFRAVSLLGLVAFAAAPVSAEPLRVSAASSLTEAFGEIAALFELSHPGADVELNFSGSQILRAQIELGAPVDVFAAADVAQMDPLVKAKRAHAPRIFAHNRLVAVASSKSGTVDDLRDLGEKGVRIVIADATVPVGRYTAQCIEKAAADSSFGKGFKAGFEENIVSRETNVRAVLTKVSLGEADAGIVYRTDVGAAPNVSVLPIPDRMNVIATYPIAVIAATDREELAEAFVTFVISESGRAILRRFGFDE